MAELEGRTRCYRVRPGTDEDGPFAARLISDIFSEYDGVIFDINELPDLKAPRSAFRNKFGDFFVVEFDGDVIATGAFELSADGLTAELYRFYVHKDHRSEGIAQYLLEMVERIVAAKDVQVIHLWSDTRFLDAHRFYKRNQYVQLKETRALNDVSDTIEFHFSKSL